MEEEAWISDEQQNKMFVGGLAQTVTSETLKSYFSNYGPVQDAFVLMDEQSGRSRGFGFVTFQDPQTLAAVLRQRLHVLGNKQVDCKHAVNKTSNNKRSKPSFAGGGFNSNSNNAPPCNPPALTSYNNSWASACDTSTSHPLNLQEECMTAGTLLSVPNINDAGSNNAIMNDEVNVPIHVHGPAQTDGNAAVEDVPSELFLTGGGKSYLALSGDKWLEDCEEADARKIFVGGLPDITPLEFAKYFEHFGEVADAMIMFDRKRRRQRGFGFITFVTDEGVRKALTFNRHPVKGKVVEVKKAHPLVLQNARAPARKEREAELRQQIAQNKYPEAPWNQSDAWAMGE